MCGSGADPTYVDGLHRESEDLGVVWLERRVDVAPLMAAADLLVLPSLVPETQGMVVIEAMSCGIPVVASAVGGLPETLDGFTDQLVSPGDAGAVAAALDRLVDWRRCTPDLGADARRRAVERFALADSVAAVAKVLDGAGR